MSRRRDGDRERLAQLGVLHVPVVGRERLQAVVDEDAEQRDRPEPVEVREACAAAGGDGHGPSTPLGGPPLTGSGRPFEHVREAQHPEVVAATTDDLQADRQAVVGEPTGHRDRG